MIYTSTAKVRAVICGHDHDGGYHFELEHRIHFVTLPSPLEAVNFGANETHGILKVFEDRMELEGSGTVKSQIMYF